MSTYKHIILIKYTNYISILKSLTKNDLANLCNDFRSKVISNKCKEEDIELIDILTEILEIEVNKLKDMF